MLTARQLARSIFRVRRPQDRVISSDVTTRGHAADRYKPGAFLLTHPGQIFYNRYQIVNKLGSGQYSDVFIVNDLRTQTRKALKIQTAQFSAYAAQNGPDEIAALLSVRNASNPNNNGGKLSIIQLLDHFQVTTAAGASGTHNCLVLELLGANVFQLSRLHEGSRKMPEGVVRNMTRNVLSGLSYLHDVCGLIYADLKPDNIAIAEAEYHPTSLDDPKLLTTGFKILDFGSANFVSKKFASVIQPVALRAPEVILDADWGTKADIFSLGCVVYELLCGRHLFNPSYRLAETGLTQTQTHLLQMVGLLGEFPRRLVKAGSRSHEWFDENGKLLKDDTLLSITISELIAMHLDSKTLDLELIAGFLEKTLRLDPGERPSATELLSHPWLTQYAALG